MECRPGWSKISMLGVAPAVLGGYLRRNRSPYGSRRNAAIRPVGIADSDRRQCAMAWQALGRAGHVEAGLLIAHLRPGAALSMPEPACLLSAQSDRGI
jgi:hypothetical protein